MSEHEKKQTRRGFLISSAAAAALAAAAGMAAAAPPPAPGDPATKPGDPATKPRGGGGRGNRDQRAQRPVATTKSKYSQINVAFIGIEGQGGTNLRGMAEAGANVYALCDIDSEKLDRRKEDFPNAKYYSDFREMLDKEQKNIDAVVVSTPDHTHAPAAMMAMRMKKHLYCEKPLTYDIHEARTLTEAARKYGVKTQMGNQGQA